MSPGEAASRGSQQSVPARMYSTGLGFRLALGASLLVATAAIAIAWAMLAVVRADLHHDLERRSGAVAKGLARTARPLLEVGDRTRLQALLDEIWDEEEVARAEIRSAVGGVLAARTFSPGRDDDRAVAAPIVGPPDPDGFRETLGSVHVVLSGARNDARHLAYLERTVQVTTAVVALGVLLAAALAWGLSRPLRHLQRTATALAAGRYLGSLPVGGPREVQRLGEVVAQAIAAVAARELELKEANDRLHALNQQLHTTNEKLQRTEEAREAMTHMLVHDLKGPISNLLMMLDVFEADVHPDDRPLLEEGRQRCRGLLEMVQDLLAMGRIEAGHLDLERRPEPVEALARRAVAQVEHLARTRKFPIEIKNLAPPETTVACEGRLMERVLVNLLVNALRHGRPPLGILIEAADDIVWVVEDGGAGVPPDRVEQVFEKFHKGPGSRGGTGLGLAFVRLVVRAHGGDVTVRGARFEVRLPRSEGP